MPIDQQFESTATNQKLSGTGTKDTTWGRQFFAENHQLLGRLYPLLFYVGMMVTYDLLERSGAFYAEGAGQRHFRDDP